MVQEYKKIGVTTDGYRGKRAILQERVIEGLEKPSFSNNVFNLSVDSPKTIYLTNENFSNGYYIVLPDATTLWKNWQISIINDSDDSCPIYYYSTTEQLNLYKEVSAGNMMTCILLDNNSNSDISGTWTTLRTTETSDAEELYKYTSDVFEEVDITWNELLRDTSTVAIPLGNVLRGTSVKSIYIKPTEQFLAEDSDESTIDQIDLKVSVGTENNPSLFIEDYDLSGAITDTNFTKDLYDEMLSTTSNVGLIATFSGNDIQNLISGEVKVVIEKARLIDPTILKNPIVQTQIPIGVIMNYIFNDGNNRAPSGYWRLDGSLFPNATSAIPDFVNKLKTVDASLSGEKLIVTSTVWNNIYNTYGSCGKFCWVGTSLRFPAINCFIQGLSDMNQLAKLTDAGLPNITGTAGVQPGISGRDYRTGAFYTSENNIRVDSGTSNSWALKNLAFDASRSNSIYGKSDTVTPLNIKYPYIISVYNTFQNSSAIVVDEIIENSVNKANTNLDNIIDVDPAFVTRLRQSNILMITDSYYSPNTGNGMNWYRIWSDGWVEQGGSIYIASNGQIVNLLIPMQDNSYACMTTGGTRPYGNTVMFDQTTTNFKAWTSDDSSFNAGWLYWKIEGKGAI